MPNPLQFDFDRDGIGDACDPVEGTFNVSDLRLRVARSGEGKLRFRGMGESLTAMPGSVTIVDATNGTLHIDVAALATRTQRCHESRTSSVCTSGNVRWKVTPAAGDFAVRAVELKMRSFPGADVLLPATAPLTVTLEGQRVGPGEDIQLVGTAARCTTLPRSGVLCGG